MKKKGKKKEQEELVRSRVQKEKKTSKKRNKKMEERGRQRGYRRSKKEYKELCEEKKKEKKERIIREAGEARTEMKVWEVINRERKSKKRINEAIELETWKEYFMGLLGGVEKRTLREMKRKEGRRGKDEKEMEMEEIKGAIGRLEEGEGVRKGRNIEQGMEVWREGDEELGMEYVEGCGEGKDGQINGEREGLFQ